MRAALDAAGYDRNPHHIAPDCWYYETPGGIEVFYDGRLICIIRWRSLVASLKRHIGAKGRR